MAKQEDACLLALPFRLDLQASKIKKAKGIRSGVIKNNSLAVRCIPREHCNVMSAGAEIGHRTPRLHVCPKRGPHAHGSRECVQVLRLLENLYLVEVSHAIEDALYLGAHRAGRRLYKLVAGGTRVNSAGASAQNDITDTPQLLLEQHAKELRLSTGLHEYDKVALVSAPER